MQAPSVGRIVHFYVGPKFETQPAIITRVYSDTCVRLTVFAADGSTYLADSVEHANNAEGRWWCWPPRVEPILNIPPPVEPVEPVEIGPVIVTVDVGGVAEEMPAVEDDEDAFTEEDA